MLNNFSLLQNATEKPFHHLNIKPVRKKILYKYGCTTKFLLLFSSVRNMICVLYTLCLKIKKSLLIQTCFLHYSKKFFLVHFTITISVSFIYHFLENKDFLNTTKHDS